MDGLRPHGGDDGRRNYLIEGVSGTGKTTVAEELQRRGFHVLHGDRELAYRGDPETGEPLDEPSHESPAAGLAWRQRHWVWDEGKVRSVLADHRHPISFLCGGSRNFAHFIHLFDGVFVLDVDPGILKRRLARRPEDEFGGRPEEQVLIMRLHATKEDIPESGMEIDSARPVTVVVDDILSRCGEAGQGDN